MAAHEIEIILSRQWSDYLSIPVFITDPDGNLIYFNEPAEEVLGRRFEDTAKHMPMSEWATVFTPTDADGNPLKPDDLPLVKTLKTRKPSNGGFSIESHDGKKHHINVVSFPIVGMSEGYLGAIAIFWINQD